MKPDGSLRLAVVSDTHGRPHANTRPLLRSLAPEAVLHAGDIGDLSVLEELREVAPVFAVRGNIDTRADAPPDDLLVEVLSSDETSSEPVLRILLTHIALYGPKLLGEVAMRARKEGAQMVVCGHSHVPFIGRDRGLTVFNPGSIGPRRFNLPIVFGTFDLSPSGVRLAHVDCETGQAWSPP